MAMRYCLDTNTAIYFLAGRLSEPLPEGEWLISVITELELRSYSFATPGDERSVVEFIGQILVVDLTREMAFTGLEDLIIPESGGDRYFVVGLADVLGQSERLLAYNDPPPEGLA